MLALFTRAPSQSVLFRRRLCGLTAAEAHLPAAAQARALERVFAAIAALPADASHEVRRVLLLAAAVRIELLPASAPRVSVPPPLVTLLNDSIAAVFANFVASLLVVTRFKADCQATSAAWSDPAVIAHLQAAIVDTQRAATAAAAEKRELRALAQSPFASDVPPMRMPAAPTPSTTRGTAPTPRLESARALLSYVLL
jgi:hypothetical protein